MSKLTATPYIESVLAGLSDESLGALLSLANGSDAEFQRVGFFKGNKKISELENGVYGVKFEDRLGEELKIGYLIKKESGTHLLCYSETSAPYVALRIYKVENISLVFKDEISSVEYRNYLVDKRQSAGTVVVANPTLEGDEEELEGIEIDGEKFKMPSGGGGGIVEACVVNVDDEDGITLQEWITKCEAGDYDEDYIGSIATITNLIDKKTFRLILIGIDHDVIASSDLGELEPNGTKAKTTWQFYDMPMVGVMTGLPFLNEDPMEGEEGAPEFDPTSPVNWFGMPSATNLLHCLSVIFSSLPLTLQKAIKTVRKDCYIPVVYFDDYAAYNSTTVLIQSESERYGIMEQKLFHLSAAEVGIEDTAENNGHFPISCTRTNWETEEDEKVMLEGHKYAYFDTTNPFTANSKLVRYNHKGEAHYWWLRSPGLEYSSYWGYVDYGGIVYYNYTYYDYGVAPAFCI